MPPPCLFKVHVCVEYPGDEDEEDEEDGDFDDICRVEVESRANDNTESFHAMNRLIEKQLKPIDHFLKDQIGQTQLEKYGFLNSRVQPSLQCSHKQLAKEHFRKYVAPRRRASTCYSYGNYNIPVLLQVCQESRYYLISLGYGLVFSTYTSPAQFWFNFKEDILIIERVWAEGFHWPAILDGGSFNMGQCPTEELHRVRRLAILLKGYCYGDKVPDEIHEVVQMFGNLEELFVADCVKYEDHYDDHDPPIDFAFRNPIFVDACNEERWGYHIGWEDPRDPKGEQAERGSWHYYNFGPRSFSGKSAVSTLSEASEDFERQLSSHTTVTHEMMDDDQITANVWKTPRVRFVYIMEADTEATFLQGRESFRNYIGIACNSEFNMVRGGHLYDGSIEEGYMTIPGRDIKCKLIPYC